MADDLLAVLRQTRVVSDALELLIELEMELRHGIPFERERWLLKVQRVVGEG